MAFVPDTPAPTKFVPDAPAAPPSKNFFDYVKGAADAGYSGLSHVLTAPISGAEALILRGVAAATGGNPDEAAQAAKDFVDRNLVYHTQTDVGKDIAEGTGKLLAPTGALINKGVDLAAQGGEHIGIPAHETRSALSETGDILNALPIASLPKAAADAASGATAATAANTAADATRGSFATGEGQNMAKSVAGPSGVYARVLHNSQIADVIAHHEAGVPHGTDLTSDSLATAREAPSAVYNRVATALPAGPISPDAQTAITAAGDAGRITKGSPDAIKQINDLRDKLLDPQGNFTGDQVVNELRGLRQEGYKNIASDDVSNQQIGKAQLDMAKGLETHIEDTLPANADVSVDQLKAAREALAKNHAVEASLTGPKTGELDPKAMARMHEAGGNMLTGGLQNIAEAAQANPKAFGVASKIDVPPSYVGDVMHGSSINPESLLSIGGLSSFAGGKVLARRALTGDTQAAVDATKGAFPGRDDSVFAPIDRTPQPPPGMTASPPTAPAAPAGGPPGQIGLADLLSHGVEQSPAPGLSLAQGPAPQAGGLPFTRDPSQMAGGLSLMDELLGKTPENNSGLADVMSSRVPDGTMTRTPKKPKFVAGDVISNNASGESSASLESQSRLKSEKAAGTKRVIIDQDGNERPVAQTVDAVDAKADRGSVLAQKDKEGNYTVLDRGGMAPALVKGLLERAKILGRPLGQSF